MARWQSASWGGSGNGAPPPPGAPRRLDGRARLREKIERDCLKLIQALVELKRDGGDQSLRVIAERAGMSKDEVNRYLSPIVRELYDFERLLHVRRRNRPLYNWLIVSGPPQVEDGRWAGILCNTSKFVLFQAVCQKYGYVARHLGRAGAIVDLEYFGVEALRRARLGQVWGPTEAVLAIDEFPPRPGPAP